MATNGHNGTHGRTNGTRHRLLIVEDERVLREAVARFFESRGMEVTRAGSLSEALHCLDGDGFDLVLLDVGLPDGDGLSLLAHAPADRAVVVSANPDPCRYEEMGVVHHLAKPVDMIELSERLQAIVTQTAA